MNPTFAVPHDTRDLVVDFVRDLSTKTEISTERMVGWIGIAKGKFYEWTRRYGKANEHNDLVPRDHWIDDTERQAILDFHDQYPLEGYRRLTFMMIDRNVVAVSPASTYRVLARAGRLDRWNPKPSKKGTGFIQPLAPHEHWHIDVAYLQRDSMYREPQRAEPCASTPSHSDSIVLGVRGGVHVSGTFYYLCSVLDGASRAIAHWEIRERMTETDIECILEGARERFPNQTPRVISDNGPQFVARDFKEYIRIAGMSHVRTSPYYPQSNGKIERWHKTLKSDAIRPSQPSSLDHSRSVVGKFVDHYNGVRLHSAIGYIAPNDALAGRSKEIWADRDRKLDLARERRRLNRQAANEALA